MATRSHLEGARLAGNLNMEKNRYGMGLLKSTGGNVALTADHQPALNIQATAAFNLRLPAASAALKGLWFWLINTSTGAFRATLQTSTGGALVPAAGVNQNRTGMAICTGSVWKTLGTTTA